MRIVVAVKQVASRDSTLKVDASGTWLEESDLAYEMNEPDAYALEEALQLREKQGGEVIVLCAGPTGAGPTIREALAKGADWAIHVQTASAAMLDPLETARLLAKALEDEKPDLILTGLQSDDLGYGQTGAILAELLSYSHVTIVIQVEAGGVEQGRQTLRVKRELEDGWYQHVSLSVPAVLTIQSGIRRLRYATLMGIKKAKTKEVKVLAASQLAPQASTLGLTIDRLSLPARNKKLQMLSGDAKQTARELVEKLRFEARVL